MAGKWLLSIGAPSFLQLFQLSHNSTSYLQPNETEDTQHSTTFIQHKELLTLGWWPGASLQGHVAWEEVGGGESAVCACPILNLSTEPPGLLSVILKVNNNHNRQPIIASLFGWEVYNLNSWQREKLAQSLAVMVHGEPVGHDCYLMQGNQAAALNIHRH